MCVNKHQPTWVCHRVTNGKSGAYKCGTWADHVVNYLLDYMSLSNKV